MGPPYSVANARPGSKCTSNCNYEYIWYSWVDSNHRPPDPQSSAHAAKLVPTFVRQASLPLTKHELRTSADSDLHLAGYFVPTCAGL
jgi:hypothetical protein